MSNSPETIEIKGVWLTKTHGHLGNQIEVLVQLADGSYRTAITEVADDGPISHFVYPSGILTSPVHEFAEVTE